MNLAKLRYAVNGLGLVLLALVLAGMVSTVFSPARNVVELGFSLGESSASRAAEEGRVLALAESVFVALAASHDLPLIDDVRTEAESGAVACSGDTMRISHVVHASRPAFSRYFSDLAPALQTAGLTVCSRGYRVDNSLADMISGSLGWGSAVVALGVLLWMGRRYRRDGRLPWSSTVSTSTAVVLGLAVAALAVGVEMALIQLAQALDFPLPDAPDPLEWQVAGSWPIILGVVMTAPLVEEFAFRAWFLEQASKAVGALPALALSVVPFVVVHGPQTVMHGLLFVVAGLLLGLLWLRTRSLLCCVVAHGGHNAAVLAWG